MLPAVVPDDIQDMHEVAQRDRRVAADKAWAHKEQEPDKRYVCLAWARKRKAGHMSEAAPGCKDHMLVLHNAGRQAGETAAASAAVCVHEA